MLDDLDDLGPRLSTEEAAAFLGRSHSTLARWREEGEGPKYLKLGVGYVYPAKWLKEFLLASTVVPKGKSE